jgi:hypothetical protein
MSTRINVTVGDGGLLDRNAQQTAANRQARVLADRRAAAEAEGVERRAADRTAAGLDPLTGLPASTPSSASTLNRLDQEPAANRRGEKFNVGSAWIFTEPGQFAGGLWTGWQFGSDWFRDAVTTSIGSLLLKTSFSIGAKRNVLIGSSNGLSWITDEDGVFGPQAPSLPPSGPELFDFIEYQGFDRDECNDRIVTNPQPFRGRISSSQVTNINYFALPAGGKNFVLVRFNSYYYHLLTLGATATGPEASQPELQSSGFLHLRRGAEFQPHQLISDHASRVLCYYCTPASITEITTPTAITELFEAFVPRIPDSTGSYRASAELTSACPSVTPPRVTITIPGGGFAFAGQTFMFRPDNIQQFNSGYAGYGFSFRDTVYTPYVYEVINGVYEFTSPANIKSLPSTLKWGMPDASTNSAFDVYRTSSSSLSARVLEAYADPRPFRYAVWPQRGEFPDIDAWEEGYEGPRPIKVPQANQPKSEQRPPRTGPYDVANRLVVTDWNDPRYCRARLQDLGFNLNQLA